MKHIFLAAALLALSPAAAMAQADDDYEDYGPDAGDWEVTLSGTGSSDNDFDRTILGATGSLGYYLGESFLLGARQNVNWADTEDDDVVNASTVGFLDFVFDLGRFRPFLGINFGGIYGEQVSDTLIAGPEGGLKFYADENTFVFGQAQYDVLFDDLGSFDDAFDDGNLVYTLGIGFNF